jgi:hypothetical protein
MDADWLKEESRFVTIGHLQPGWRLTKALLCIVERDQAGHYFISNEPLGLYAVGLTRGQAMLDFQASLIDNYQHLERQAGKDLDLKILFWEYQKYLERSN